jgi:hypothetical protein
VETVSAEARIGTPSSASVAATREIYGAGRTIAAFDGALPIALNVTSGRVLQFEATGSISSSSDAVGIGPDGDQSGTNLNAFGGISRMSSSRGMFLAGVFLGPFQASSPAPGPSAMNDTYTALSPGLQQVFFIGDGQTASAVPHSVTVPVGATRLFLGFGDGNFPDGEPSTYFDNTGSLNVTVFSSSLAEYTIAQLRGMGSFRWFKPGATPALAADPVNTATGSLDHGVSDLSVPGQG